ncbi:hypothetical protein [Clostridium saccharobutylicum]|uniref:Spore coat protein n=2 Tax=Clostridium saccharobutylicum TaxID=169679 RepID=U5MX87_CLOSA|nr:hypothetical protein [Clostridium saccharobutylicum]AGX44246.1 hypothetical protein CLSA_c32820 [Clostridium saccharobutylicum DSM 13864]AQR91535.1 hypothetical protein CLOSC_32610 [Clostridium saccharobutylicum]AQS01440.1 hypothetical protein CSACC_32690 [Clostridium saccharobutylicum]AQS11049.1 hypothetical protein CLOBY_31990 [Clostridium saccharobutylicum]AQS15423.1 hypothetical protein CLOSACC_32690 [Clostridium saccharobutylicum]
MSKKNNLTPHEILELRELMDNNIIGVKKMQASIPMIKDDELKSFMEKCLDCKKENINSMQTFIENNISMQ